MSGDRTLGKTKSSIDEIFGRLVKEARITRSKCIRHTRRRHDVLWSEEQQPVKYLFLCLVETLAHHTRFGPDEVSEDLYVLRNAHKHFSQQERRDWLVRSGLIDA